MRNYSENAAKIRFLNLFFKGKLAFCVMDMRLYN